MSSFLLWSWWSCHELALHQGCLMWAMQWQALMATTRRDWTSWCYTGNVASQACVRVRWKQGLWGRQERCHAEIIECYKLKFSCPSLNGCWQGGLGFCEAIFGKMCKVDIQVGCQIWVLVIAEKYYNTPNTGFHLLHQSWAWTITREFLRADLLQLLI